MFTRERDNIQIGVRSGTEMFCLVALMCFFAESRMRLHPRNLSDACVADHIRNSNLKYVKLKRSGSHSANET